MACLLLARSSARWYPSTCSLAVRGKLPPVFLKRASAIRTFSSVSGSPSQSPEDPPVAKASLTQLWNLLRPERTRLQLAFVALLGSSSVTLSYPAMMGKLVDAFGVSSSTSTSGGGVPEALFPLVLEHSTSFSMLILAGGAATFARLYLLETAIERIQFRLRQQFFGTLLGEKVAFFDRNRSGELIARLGNDITVTSRVLMDLSQGARSCLSASFGTLMLVTLAPSDMIVSFSIPAVAMFGGAFAYGRFVRRVSAQRQEHLAASMQHADERIAGMRIVRLFNAERKELLGFQDKLDLVYEAGRKNALASAGLSCVFVSGGGLFLLSVFYNCGVLIQTGSLTMGTSVSLAMYSVLAGSSLTGLASAYGEVQKSLGACGRVLSVLERKERWDEQPAQSPEGLTDPTRVPLQHIFAASESSSAISAPAHAMSLSFRDVHFSYPARPDLPVLCGVSLDVPAGSRLAVVGRSGSGKSTLSNLICGLYEPSQGEVLADDQNIFSSSEDGIRLRDQVGVVPQDASLFGLSIRENIEYGMHSGGGEDEAKLLQLAVKTAHVTDFTDGLLPGKLDTFAGERGSALSGGQKQRVCIARALARRPRLLIFDEATSALDTKSEALVQEGLRSILGGKGSPLQVSPTVLLITHRLSTLQFVDQIAVMDGGRVVQHGETADVLANPGQVLQQILASGESSG